MQVVSYCTCTSYNLNLILDLLSASGRSCTISYDVLYFEINHESAVFIFDFGCIVFWGVDAQEQKSILDSIATYAEDLSYSYTVEKLEYKFSEKSTTHIDEESDVVMLGSNEIHLRLSLSYGFAQSAKLEVIENYIEKTINENKSIPLELIKTGKISLSRKELAKKIGNLFSAKNSASLNTNVLDTPDFFWKKPMYEQYYEMAVYFMELEQRISVLDTRLNVIQELYGILSTELQHSHSSRLEMIIIFLIMVEVVLVLMRDFFL